MTKVSIIIVHWNTPTSLKKLLPHLLKEPSIQTIVVDNASSESLEWVKKEFSEMKFIQNRVNQGFARACNQGTTEAVGEWLLFLNPDVEINSEEIEQLVDFAETHSVDACSPKTPASPQGESDDYEKPLPTLFTLLVEFSPLRHLVPLSVFKKKTLFGGCLLIKKKVFDEVGGWDERFFLWFEDSDLTLRLKKSGFMTTFAPLHIRHKGGSSFKLLNLQKQKDIFFHSMEVFAKKHFSVTGRAIVRLIRKRFSKKTLLPVMHEGLSMTVPNMKRELLQQFLAGLSPISGVEWTVVTSSIEPKNIWSWRKKYPHARFILIEKNKGFSSTVNIGFRASASKLIGTINDDAIVPKGTLKNLISYIGSDPSIGSINPVIYKSNGSIESVGIQILILGKAIPLQKPPYPITDNFTDDRRQFGYKKELVSVDATNAACVVYSSDALNKVGLFDERFGSYLEDIDLSLRLKRAGYKNTVCPGSSIIHRGQETSKDFGSKKTWLDFKNWILVILKNWSLKDLFLHLPSILLERGRNISGILKQRR